jgi:hypothetical protein
MAAEARRRQRCAEELEELSLSISKNRRSCGEDNGCTVSSPNQAVVVGIRHSTWLLSTVADAVAQGCWHCRRAARCGITATWTGDVGAHMSAACPPEGLRARPPSSAAPGRSAGAARPPCTLGARSTPPRSEGPQRRTRRRCSRYPAPAPDGDQQAIGLGYVAGPAAPAGRTLSGLIITRD